MMWFQKRLSCVDSSPQYTFTHNYTKYIKHQLVFSTHIDKIYISSFPKIWNDTCDKIALQITITLLCITAISTAILFYNSVYGILGWS